MFIIVEHIFFEFIKLIMIGFTKEQEIEFCCRGLLPLDQCESRYDPANPETHCDQAVKTYCDANPYDPYCACFNSPVEHPDCNDEACRASGAYVPSTMRLKKCPPVLNCQQEANLNEVYDTQFNLVQNQNCSIDMEGNISRETTLTQADLENGSYTAPPPPEPVPIQTQAPTETQAASQTNNQAPPKDQTQTDTPHKDQAPPGDGSGISPTIIIAAVVGVIVIFGAISAGMYFGTRKANKDE